MEGPEKTTEPQVSGFRTYAPLKVERTNCEERWKCTPRAACTCPSTTPGREGLRSEVHRVSPAIKDMIVVARHSSISIIGRTKGRTTYT